MANDAFDLFAFLGKLSRRDLHAYDKLTPEGQKAASPLVIGRWLTGTSDEAQLLRLNTFANPYVFSLGQDKALLFSLLAGACTGSTSRYTWIKPPGSKAQTRKLQTIASYYGCSLMEAKELLAVTTNETVLQMAEELGYDKDELKKLEGELDGPRSPAPPSRKPKKH